MNKGRKADKKPKEQERWKRKMRASDSNNRGKGVKSLGEREREWKKQGSGDLDFIYQMEERKKNDPQVSQELEWKRTTTKVRECV